MPGVTLHYYTVGTVDSIRHTLIVILERIISGRNSFVLQFSDGVYVEGDSVIDTRTFPLRQQLTFVTGMFYCQIQFKS
jgi:hypothetical protein